MVTFLQGDCLEVLKTLSAESVQCVVTSPPYYGLRDYGVDGQIGLEQSPDEYVAKMVAVFREVRRVLRDDGVVWLNLGDSYATHFGKRSAQFNGDIQDDRNDIFTRNKPTAISIGLKEKDLLGIPWRVAFALQADGWWLRSDIIWHKPNPMPESVKDRPTKSHEYVFLLSKSQKYYYDAEAIKELATGYDGRKDDMFKGAVKSYDGVMPNGQPQSFAQNGHKRWEYKNLQEDGQQPNTMHLKRLVGDEYMSPVRNKRTVWTIPTQPYSGAHFATFPTALVSPCILAGTSAKGCCPECGKPWKRILEKVTNTAQRNAAGKNNDTYQRGRVTPRGSPEGDFHDLGTVSVKMLGWRPDCTCHGHFETIKVQESYTAKATGTHDTKRIYIPDNDQPEPVPCVVLDPFMGSGTTLLVATQYGRDSIGIELNPEYIELAKKRLDQVQIRMTL